MQFIEVITEVFSSREIATFLWALLLILVLNLRKKIRCSSWNLIKAFFQYRIITNLLLALIYCEGIVLLLIWAEFWETSLLKDTIFWYVGFAIVTLMSLANVNKEQNFFSKLLIGNFKLLLILEFVTNFHQFPLVTEIILIAVVVILAMIQAYSERREEYAKVVNLINIIFGIATLIFLTFSIIDIVQGIEKFVNYQTLKKFLLPIILGVLFIPFAYMDALYMNYEVLFQRLNFQLSGNSKRAYSKWRLILRCNFRLGKQKRILKNVMRLYTGSTIEHIQQVIK